MGAAYGVLITTAIMLPLMYARMLGLLKSRPGDYARLLWRPALASAAMIAGIALLQRWLAATGFGDAYIVELLTSVSVGAAIYAASLLLMWRLAGMPPGGEAHLVEVTCAALRRTPRRATTLGGRG